ncbi:hypothetical protein HAT86_06865 [Roseovarius gahaiensis]|uniref:Uncharacterized protein n=1 Tax=Roseovarius gahaiensis TaxID=2716691 RepID=A0A967BCU2_9RHOB|nr:hypothetical protein [Roseovarius gahaiensis]NHQ74185.1 hypothetical protein [Roseovarius gahaiensis]
MRAGPDTYTEFHQDLWKAVAENLSEEERDRCFAQADAAQMAIFSYAASLGSHYFKDLEQKAAIGTLRRYVWAQVGLWGIILGVGLFIDRGLGAPHNLLALLALFVFQLFWLGDIKAEERWLRYECFKLQIKLRDERLQCAAKLPRVDPPYIQAVIEPFCAMFLVQGELQGITEEFQEFGRDRDKILDTWYVFEEYPKVRF